MMEVFEYVVIAGVFIGGMIPLVGGTIDYYRDKKRLDRERKAKEA